MTRQRTILLSLVVLIGAGLMAYAETWAFAWDEGFHLLAAQLILKGMRPYLDFFHAQTPLYAYWNAFWMRIFGDTWHTAHAVSAVCTTGAVWLTGDYVLDRFEGGIWRQNWRFPMALAAIALTGFNSQIIQFATIGQAYGICLLAIVAAFRLAVSHVERDDACLAAGVGFFAGVAAASSLLTAPIGPVLFVWMLRAPGGRIKRTLAFIGGGLIPFVPLFRLLVKSPKVVFFGAVKYHLLYRTVDWSGSATQNIDVASSWLESPHAMLLGLLTLLALIFLSRNQIPWPLRQELHLCLWLSVFEGGYLLYVRPTFPRYFLFIVPFVAIISVVGFYYAGIHIGRPDKPVWVTALVVALMTFGAARTVLGGRGDYTWFDWEKISKKVSDVTPPGGIIDADEAVYFLSRRAPPSGMEYDDTHKLHLSKELSEQLHVFSKEELERRVKAGVFDTVAVCDEDKSDELATIYKDKASVGDCDVYWQRIKH